MDEKVSSVNVDVVIVGAGISGINAAYRIQTQSPGTSYVILEARDDLGGTWDLFRYPGIRSDSDIFTFGFAWSPWDHQQTMASGDQIKDYLAQSTRTAGIDRNISYRHSVESADWRSADKRWSLRVNVRGEEKPVMFSSRFILLGTGYYDYKTPLQAIIPGIENFQGKVIHPQFWPKDDGCTGKDVVIIGSGATAVTILPSILDKAKHATMLQRSPGYIFPLPSNSFITMLLFAIMPRAWAQTLNRLLWVVRSHATTVFCRRFPEVAKRLVKKVTIQQLPPDMPWDPHCKPRYNPWEQRFCASMDGDFFSALRSGKGAVVTDTIEKVTKDSIQLASGKSLHPDVIVTATGLKLKFGGGIRFTVDDELVDPGQKFAWKAAMVQDMPNLVFITGYETASWTLGADVSAQLFTRLLRVMKQKNVSVATPRVPVSADMHNKAMLNLSSTYIRDAPGILPKGGEGIWSPKTNYLGDIARAKWGDVTTDLVLS